MNIFNGLGSCHSHMIYKYKMHWDKNGVGRKSRVLLSWRRMNNGTNRWLNLQFYWDTKHFLSPSGSLDNQLVIIEWLLLSQFTAPVYKYRGLFIENQPVKAFKLAAWIAPSGLAVIYLILMLIEIYLLSTCPHINLPRTGEFLSCSDQRLKPN